MHQIHLVTLCCAILTFLHVCEIAHVKQEQQRVAVGTQKGASHFWSPDGVRCRPHRTASAAARGAAVAGLLFRANIIKKIENFVNFFSGKHQVKFGHFVNFSYISGKNVLPQS